MHGMDEIYFLNVSQICILTILNIEMIYFLLEK